MTAELTAPISAQEYASYKAQILATLAEMDPTLDLSMGSAMVGLVVENEAQLAAAQGARYDALNLSFSLAAIAANLATVDDAHVDSVISNYFITRKVASAASGPVVVVTSLNTSYVIPAGFQVSSGGGTFSTQASVRVYPTTSAVTTSATTKQLVKRVDGLYEFTLTMVADAAGLAGQLSAGTTVLLVNPLDGMQSAVVATDFSGGSDTETNASLLARAQQGITAATLSGPEQIQAALTLVLPGIKTAVLGIGSPLMTRNRGNIFGISVPGTEDIYVKSSAFPQTKTLMVQATAFDAARSMAFTLTGTDAAGVYRIVAIRPVSAVGAQGDLATSVTPMIRSDLVFTPKTLVPADYIYGSIADLRVVFTDDITPTATVIASGATLSYYVDVLYMPSVSVAGDYCYGKSRPAGTDYLVKAGVPCLVDVAITLRPAAGSTPPTILDVQAAIAAAINALPFGTPRLSLYVVLASLQPLSFQGDVVDIQLAGEILASSGAAVLTVPSQGVAIPTDLSNGFSPENAFFACPTGNVTVTYVS